MVAASGIEAKHGDGRGGEGEHERWREREIERERLEREREMEEQIRVDVTILGFFCKCLPPRFHVACHLSFGGLRGAFETSDEPLNTIRDSDG